MECQRTDVAVLGGGLIGLCIALLIRAEGLDVTVIERGELGGGASRGNAGWMCAALIEPLPSPAALRELVHALRRTSPLWIRPRPSGSFFRWGAGFISNSRTGRAKRNQDHLTRLAGLLSNSLKELERTGFDDPRSADGLLVVYEDAKRARADWTRLTERCKAARLPVPSELIGTDDVRRLEPALSGRLVGFELPSDRWTNPSTVVDNLGTVATRSGVHVLRRQGAARVVTRHAGVAVETGSHDIRASRGVVIAAGASTPELLQPLGLDLPIEAGKGYSFFLHPQQPLRRAVYLPKSHLALTPFGEKLRVAGTMEIGGHNSILRVGRIDAMVESCKQFLHGVPWGERTGEWVGSRPLSPDGLPVIGAIPGIPGLFVASAHGMWGLSLCAPTAFLVRDLVLGRSPEFDLTPFSPARLLRRARTVPVNAGRSD